MADALTFPRWVHQTGGLVLLVDDAVACDRAVADGWSLVPIAMSMQKGDETTTVYTAEALHVALSQGWTLVVASPAADVPVVVAKPKKGAK